MNKYILFTFMGLTVLFTACLKEQEDLFSESPALRLNKTIDAIDSALIQASNGWVLEYFATSESPGYSMLINFGSNGEVVVAAKNNLVNNKYTEAKSSFDVIGDNGPVLTFNTYNDVLHLFSTPENPNGSGLEGDYEFIVLNYSDSLISLKGKKRGTEISLIRLPENILWADYFIGLDKMNDDLFGSSPLYFVSDSDISMAYNGVSHIFEMTVPDSNNIFIPFIVTIDGLKFYSPYETESNKKVQSFYLNEEGNKLISSEHPDTYFKGTDNASFIVNSNENFVFDIERSSFHFQDLFAILSQQMNTKYEGNRDLDFVALSYSSKLGHSFYFATQPTVTKANYKIDFIEYINESDLISIIKVDGEYDSNGELFLSSVPVIDEFWQNIEGTYKLESSLSKKEIKFIDSNNSSRFFVVTI